MSVSGARVGVVIVTHGQSGREMVASIEELLGREAVAGFEALAVGPREDRELLTRRVAEAVARVDEGAGALVLCDLQGSTPANCCVDLKQHAGQPLEVLCGVSLPMLVKLASIDRRTGPEILARAAMETARRSIRLLGEEGAQDD